VIVQALTGFVNRARSFETDLEGCYPTANFDTQAMASFSPNFLPILFNVYGTAPAGERAYLLSCIEAFISITDTNVIKSQYFDRALDRLSSDKIRAVDLVSFLEISSVLLCYLDVSCHERALPVGLALIKRDGDVAVQKRAYRLIGDILSREDFEFDSSLLAQVESAFVDAYHGASDAAVKKARFRALLKIVSRLSENDLHWIPLFLPEVVLGTKEVNHQARLYSFELLLAFARRMSRGGMIAASRAGGAVTVDTAASLDEFFSMLIAGLAGATLRMNSATITALARVIFEFKESLNANLMNVLLEGIIETLASPCREMVKSALGLIKVILVSMDPSLVQGHLSNLINGVLHWSNEHHQHFKIRVRHLMERLVRRFGYERILELTPMHHRKLLTNIRKRRDRLGRQKAIGKAESRDGDRLELGQDHDADNLTSAALSSASAITKMTSIGASLRSSSRFEQALHGSDSELDSDLDDQDIGNTQDNYELPADSILRDLEDVDDDAEIEAILSRKLSLASALQKKGNHPQGTKTAKRAQSESNDDDIPLDEAGRLVIDGDNDSNDAVDDSVDERSDARKKRVRIAPEQQQLKRRRGNAKKRNDKFEPYSYVPMTRATKKNRHMAPSASAGSKGSKQMPKYFMKRA